MGLRAKKPDPVNKRLKLFMFGPAGVGKSTAAIQFPNSYIIDCERGTENYDKLINESGSVVFQTTDVHEVIGEIRSLLCEKHRFRTLVIDPISPAYSDLLDKCESAVGSEFGRHIGAANKEMKRLANLIMALDMNVVITSHAKTEYAPGGNMTVLGNTFDAWKKLDYWFDLVVELQKRGQQRIGCIRKTRIESFPDGDVFEWSYAAIKDRYNTATLEREATTVALASRDQVIELKDLLSLIRLPEGMPEKWLAKADVETWEDMPADTIQKCIDYCKSRLPAAPVAAA